MPRLCTASQWERLNEPARYTVERFDADLKEPFAWPGGYPRYFVTEDGAALSFVAARAEADLIREAIESDDQRSGWMVIGCDINWEDCALYCDHTGDRIESAYAEDEADSLSKGH